MSYQTFLLLRHLGSMISANMLVQESRAFVSRESYLVQRFANFRQLEVKISMGAEVKVSLADMSLASRGQRAAGLSQALLKWFATLLRLC